MNYEEFFRNLTRRYGHISPEALESVLCPVLIPIKRIDPTIHKIKGQSHFRASFVIGLLPQYEGLIAPGRTGKFVPASILTGGSWREICKGRILEVNLNDGIANGEIYVGATTSQESLRQALDELDTSCYLEIDQYGAAAKVLSALVEYSLAQQLTNTGYVVKRMPEDMAKHIGTYKNYDFEVSKEGATKRLEVKSLWGTNTAYARLIHSKGRDYPTSSCKFTSQDFFAVSLFLRTGNIADFAFARSVPSTEQPYGLPVAEKHPDHVNQNPSCNIGDGVWFATLDEVWKLT
jgi:hypothetical protein